MTGPGESYAELGPVLPPRGEVYARAVRLRALALAACDASASGSGCDLRQALAYLDAAAAVLGVGECPSTTLRAVPLPETSSGRNSV